MSKEKYKKVKVSTLISVVVHGANRFGVDLAKKLLEQGSRVIIVDNYEREKKPFITELKKNSGCDFIAFEGISELYKTLNRFDYLFYLQNEFLTQREEFNSKDFLEESNYLDLSLKAALKHNAKTAVVTNVNVNKQITELQIANPNSRPAPYSAMEIQKYSETLTAEYHDKSKLNVRIVRMGTILGAQYQPRNDQDLKRLLSESVEKAELTIRGEGLDSHFLIHFEDAIYGLLKLTFSDKTAGEVITLANNKAYTTLSIAYKLLELNTSAVNIKFLPTEDQRYLLQGMYTPAPNAHSYGWTSKVSLEESLIETLDSLYKQAKKRWTDKPVAVQVEKDLTTDTKGAAAQKPASPVREVKTPFGEFIDLLLSPFRWVGGKLVGGADHGSRKISQAFNMKNAFYLGLATIAFILFSYFLLTPLLLIGANSYSIYTESKAAYSDIVDLQFDKASQHLRVAQRRFKRVEVSIGRLKWVFDISGQDKLYSNISQLTFASKYSIEGAAEMTEALTPLAIYLREFEPSVTFGDSSATTTREYREQLLELQQNRGSLEKAAYKISLATNIVESTQTAAFPTFLQKYVVELKTKSQHVEEIIDPFQNIVTFLPELLGVDGRQRYLILLQNPSELRSTGGWLSSYGLIGIENGQIRQMEVDDIYNLDGSLINEGKSYDPPQSMRNALGNNLDWGLSLSNWNPDFPEAANDAEFFLKEAGKATRIDGVIAIDVTLIQNLLDKWGGIEVPGEAEVITSENLYQKIFQIHTQFTPGSQRKSTFIANLGSEVIRKVLSSDANGYKDLSSTLYEGLEQKHLLVYLKDLKANGYLSRKGWNGSIDQTYNGAPIPVEWNWGANKANLFLSRATTLDIEILGDDEIRYRYTVAVKNSSDSNVYPEGDYINFMRLLLPENADIKGTAGFRNGDYQIYDEGGFRVVGGWFDVPLQSTKTLEINYTVKLDPDQVRPFPITTQDDQRVMLLKLYKQPGTEDDSYKLNLIYPESWSVTKTGGLNEGLKKLNGQFRLDSEKQFDVAWETTP